MKYRKFLFYACIAIFWLFVITAFLSLMWNFVIMSTYVIAMICVGGAAIALLAMIIFGPKK